MIKLIEMIKNICELSGVTIEQSNYEFVYTFCFQGKTAIYRGTIEIVEQARGMLVYTRWPLKVPRSAIGRVSDFILKVNGILDFGHLDLIRNPDIVAYRTSVAWGESPVHRDIITNVLCGNWATADKYFPMFVEIIEQQKELKEIIRTSDDTMTFVLMRPPLIDGEIISENNHQSMN